MSMHTGYRVLHIAALLRMIAENWFDALFDDARRNEERTRATEHVFSFRDERGTRDPRRQQPALWNLYNGRHRPGEHVRVFPQTHRHASVASLPGISRMVPCVNKMDLMDWSCEALDDIRDEFAGKLALGDTTFIPMSALHDDNVVESSGHMPWHPGAPLHPEDVYIASDRNLIDARLPVQYVIPHSMKTPTIAAIRWPEGVTRWCYRAGNVYGWTQPQA